VSVGAESAAAFGAYPRTVLVSSFGSAASVIELSTGAFLAGLAFFGAGLALDATGAFASRAGGASAFGAAGAFVGRSIAAIG
jgi:hypothetical protein